MAPVSVGLVTITQVPWAYCMRCALYSLIIDSFRLLIFYLQNVLTRLLVKHALFSQVCFEIRSSDIRHICHVCLVQPRALSSKDVNKCVLLHYLITQRDSTPCGVRNSASTIHSFGKNSIAERETTRGRHLD